MAVEKKLCGKYYERFCELKKRREQNPVHRLDEALPKKVEGPKSKKKLVKEREIINSRRKHEQEQGPSLVELNKRVREILKTSARRTLETRIRRNDITLKSKAELGVLSELCAIYSWASYYKRSDNYSVWFLDCPDVNVNLHVCECRSSESGCYLLSCFIIFPVSLEQKIKRRYPASSSGVSGYSGSKSLYKTVLSVCSERRETELSFYSLPVKINHHPYWAKSGVVKRFPSVFGLLFYEQERLTGNVLRYVLIGFYDTLKENLSFAEIVSRCFLVELFRDIDSFFINQRLSKLEGSVDRWREGGKIWIKVYLQLIHSILGVTETEKLVNLYSSFFTDKVVTWNESVKEVKWVYEKRYHLTEGHHNVSLATSMIMGLILISFFLFREIFRVSVIMRVLLFLFLQYLRTVPGDDSLLMSKRWPALPDKFCIC